MCFPRGQSDQLKRETLMTMVVSVMVDDGDDHDYVVNLCKRPAYQFSAWSKLIRNVQRAIIVFVLFQA